MSNLYFRFEKHGRDVFVEFLRRAFLYGGPWANRELEILPVTNETGDLVFEQFFEENEKYPIITVGTQAGAHVPMAFNDQIENVYDFLYPMGVRNFALVEFATSQPFAFRLPTAFTGSLGGFVSDMVWQTGQNVDNIDIRLYQDYMTTGSVLLASGSIQNFDSTSLKTYFGGFYPYPIMSQNTDYWIEMTPQSGSVYLVGIDTSYDGQYATDISYSGSVASGSLSSGSIYGGLRYSPVFRLGGAQEFSVVIRASAKNSMEKAQNLADLTEVYVKLAQHGRLSRLYATDTRMNLSYLDGTVSLFTSQGVTIRSVSKGAVENRRRGDNDIIFTIGVTVDVRTEWNMDFDEQAIKEISVQGGLTNYQ